MVHQIVQIAGGPRVEQDAYRGSVREITAVTDAHELRLHDGIKLGGYRILDVTQNDGKYQSKDAELTGIVGLGAAKAVGIIVRKGEGTYVARELIANPASLVLAGDDTKGFNGNFTLALAPVISQDVEFTGAVVVNSLTATSLSGQLTGNVTGNVAGNLTGNVTGNVLGNLTGNAAGDHSGSFTGAVDARGESLLLDDNQIAVSVINGDLILAGDARLAFTGFVGMYSGLIANIPTGWLLCDGTLGTPDLRDRMVIGAGSAYAEGETGGSATHNHGGAAAVANAGSHNHAVTVAETALTEAQMPVHKHLSSAVVDFPDARVVGSSVQANNSIDERIDHRGGETPGYSYWGQETGGGLGHLHTAVAASDGDHNHAATISSDSNLPPYYAMAYIMKQ